MSDENDKLRRDLTRYRALLRVTTDQAAVAALKEMIAEIERALPPPVISPKKKPDGAVDD